MTRCIRLASCKSNYIRWFLKYFAVSQIIEIPMSKASLLRPLGAISGTRTCQLDRWCREAVAEEDGFGAWRWMLLATKDPARTIIQAVLQVRVVLQQLLVF